MKNYKKVRESVRMQGAILAGIIIFCLVLSGVIVAVFKSLGLCPMKNSKLSVLAFSFGGLVLFLILNYYSKKSLSVPILVQDIIKSPFTHFLVAAGTFFSVAYFM